jgi:hypothetical protein
LEGRPERDKELRRITPGVLLFDNLSDPANGKKPATVRPLWGLLSPAVRLSRIDSHLAWLARSTARQALRLLTMNTKRSEMSVEKLLDLKQAEYLIAAYAQTGVDGYLIDALTTERKSLDVHEHEKAPSGGFVRSAIKKLRGD